MEITVKEDIIKRIMQRIHNEHKIKFRNKKIVSTNYTLNDFISLIPDEEVLHNIIMYLPHLKYKNKPLVLSVNYNQQEKIYKITSQL